MPDLKLQDITKIFPGGRGLHNVSLEIPEGSLTGVVGPSGSGKTTFLRTVAGLIAPDHGKIFSGGVDITDYSPEKRLTSMVFQQPRLFPHLSVMANIALPLTIRNRNYFSLLTGHVNSSILSKVNILAESLRISHLLDRKPQGLSGGEAQRVSLARSLMPESSILLMDEPLAAVDERQRFEFRSLLGDVMEEKRKAGGTIFYVTHDLEEAQSLADQLIVLIDGNVAQLGSPKQIYTAPASLTVAQFVARTDLIVLSGLVKECTSNHFLLIEVDNPPINLHVASPCEEIAPGSKVQVIFRKGHLGKQSDFGAIGPVLAVQELGDETRARVCITGRALTIAMDQTLCAEAIREPFLVINPRDAIVVAQS